MPFLKLLESAKSGLSNATIFVSLRHVVDGVRKDVDLFSRDFDFLQIQQTYEFYDNRQNLSSSTVAPCSTLHLLPALDLQCLPKSSAITLVY